MVYGECDVVSYRVWCVSHCRFREIIEKSCKRMSIGFVACGGCGLAASSTMVWLEWLFVWANLCLRNLPPTRCGVEHMLRTSTDNLVVVLSLICCFFLV